MKDFTLEEVMYILPALVTTVVKEAEEQSTRTYASVTEEAQESLGRECLRNRLQ